MTDPGPAPGLLVAPANPVREGVLARLRRDAILLVLALRAHTPLEMARYAWRHTRFHRQHYGAEPTDFPALPLVTRDLLTAGDPYDLLSEELSGAISAYAQTSGTSGGAPVPFFLTESTMLGARWLARVSPWHTLLEEVLERNRAAVVGLPPGLSPFSPWFGDFLKAQGAVVGTVDPGRPQLCAQTLGRLRPGLLVARLADFLAWMWLLQTRWPQLAGAVRQHLRVLLLHGEVCAESQRGRLEREFGLTVVDVYASGEGFFAVPCPCGFQHVPPTYLVELADEQGRVVGRSGSGRLVFTNLARRSTPMVRYLLDDWVSLGEGPRCPYGYAGQLTVHGRWRDTVLTGGRRLAVRQVAGVLFAQGLFGDFRVRVGETRATVQAEIFSAPPPPAAIADAFTRELGLPTSVELVPFGTLTPLAGPQETPAAARLAALPAEVA